MKKIQKNMNNEIEIKSRFQNNYYKFLLQRKLNFV